MNSTDNSTAAITDECNPTAEEIDRDYNLTIHIVSLFTILFVSLLGASISVVSKQVKFLRINPIVINVGKFFGSGYVQNTSNTSTYHMSNFLCHF
jgi:hypothetical protein